MKINNLLAALPLALLCLPAAAQDDGPPPIVPVEAFTCDFNDGKGERDLDRVVADFNDWLKAEPGRKYSAVTMTPWYFSAETEFDFAWIGWWPDGATMGAGTDDWLASGGNIAARFASVITCDAHANFAAIATKTPGRTSPPETGAIAFSDCSVQDGHSIQAAMSKLSEWGQHEIDNGQTHGRWAYFPVFGAGDPDYDFKLVEPFDSHAALGRNWDWWGNGGAWSEAMDHHGHVIDCDSPRVYNFKLRAYTPSEGG